MRKFTAEETEIRNQLIEHLKECLIVAQSGGNTLNGVRSNITSALRMLVPSRQTFNQEVMPLLDPKKYGHWAKKQSNKKTVEAKAELIETQAETQENETPEAEVRTQTKKKPGRKTKENNRGQSCC